MDFIRMMLFHLFYFEVYIYIYIYNAKLHISQKHLLNSFKP